MTNPATGESCEECFDQGACSLCGTKPDKDDLMMLGLARTLGIQLDNLSAHLRMGHVNNTPKKYQGYIGQLWNELASLSETLETLQRIATGTYHWD